MEDKKTITCIDEFGREVERPLEGNECKIILPINSINNIEFPVKPNTSLIVEEEKKPKRRKKKTEITVKEEDNEELEQYKSNEPYINTYEETNNLLKGSIVQIDVLQNELRAELDHVRSSKTLKKKYDYISMLSSTVGNLIGNKITAIKEMNNSITNSHNLDLKRIKDLRASAQNDKDTDKQIMDMYQAFVSTPVGVEGRNASLLAPSMSDLTMMADVNNVSRGFIGDDSYNDYLSNISSTNNMMRLESNPSIKTVVVYDASTGNRWFDVMNLDTGESVQNVNKPDSMFLEDVTLDIRNNIARNTNLDTTYPLIVINSNNDLLEY